MKIALCLSGQLRTFNECYPNLKKYLIDVWNPDIFVYATKDSNLELPNVKQVVLEKYRKDCWDTLFDYIVKPANKQVLFPYRNSLIMFYMIYKCQQLVEQSGINYDRVIRLRPDMLLNGRIPGYVFYDDNVLWYSSYAIDKSFQVSDKFLVGTPGLMKHFAGIWKHVKKLWSTSDQLKDDKSLPVGERLVFQHLHGRGVPIASFDMSCQLYRSGNIGELFKTYKGYVSGFFKQKTLYDMLYGVYDKLPFNIKMLIPPQLDQFKHKPDYCFNGDGHNPYYIGVGFPKSGTSWWHQLILDHPCISSNLSGEKEVTFFPHYTHKGLSDVDVRMYRGLFNTDGFSGEWSPGYVYHPFVLQHIKNNFPGVKLLCMLRNPVDAYTSLLNHQLQVKKRMINVHGSRGYVYDVFSLYPECAYTFLYGHHINRLLKLFQPGQVLFLQYELCKKYPIRYIQKTYEFLDLDEHIPVNVGSRFNIRPYIVSKPVGKERETIADFYRDDIKQLQVLLPDFDYSLWRDF